MTIQTAWPPDLQQWLLPDWPAPASVRACVSTRLVPGVSMAPFDGFNLGSRCGDAAHAVSANRAALVQTLRLPNHPAWLHQVHGTDVANIADDGPGEPRADAAVTRSRGTVLAILTADCLPILFASDDGAEIAAAHAGWRGLCAGIIEQTVAAMTSAPTNIIVWLGPAIGPQVYEVGDEVREAFVACDPRATTAFIATRRGHWWCDLYTLARQRLMQLNIARVYGGNLCTFSDNARFYSHRRDQISGRMASLIWLQ